MHITAGDSGRSLTVAVGTRITVDLAPNGGSYDPPETDDPAALRRDAQHGGYPGPTDAVADFTALRRGSAHITSETDFACLHTTPRCLPPQQEFRVTITVT